MNSLVQTVRVFSSGVVMDFGIEKCALIIMKREASTLRGDKITR